MNKTLSSTSLVAAAIASSLLSLSFIGAASAFQSCQLPRRNNQYQLLNRHIIRSCSTCYTQSMLHSSSRDQEDCSDTNNNNADVIASSNFMYTTLDEIDPSSTHNHPTSRNLQQVLHTIEHAAQLAGKIALSTAGQIAIASTKANTRDLVTESDVRCQQLIKDVIRERFPRDAFLGEEDVDLSGDSSESSRAALERVLLGDDNDEDEEERLVFIVDPIDGTTNFQAGLPIYAMSIGVVALPRTSSASQEPEVVAGVIYNPALGEMTSAVRGRGCYVNNLRINPKPKHQIQDYDSQDSSPRRTTSILSQSLINVGFPISKESTLQASSKAMSALSTRVRGLRMIACASQAMAWVAQSKFNAYFSWDLNGWDVAAGIVIVEESGGMVSRMEDGGRAGVETRDIVITSCERVGEEGLLRDELIGVLKENDCLEY